MTFLRGLGYALGRGAGHALAAFGLRKGRELVDRFRHRDDEPPAAPPAIPPGAAAIVLLAFSMLGCAALREFGIGFGQGVTDGVKDCLRDPEACVPPRPTPVTGPDGGRLCLGEYRHDPGADCDCWYFNGRTGHLDRGWRFATCAPTASPAPTLTVANEPPTSTPPAPVVTPTRVANTPTPTPAPLPTIRNEPCATGSGPLWLGSTHGDWTPPPDPVPVRKTGPCPRFTVEVGPDRNHVTGCTVTWTKRAGEQGRTPAEGAQVSLANGHVVIDTDGMSRDLDNGVPTGGDAYGRTVRDGQLVPRADGLAWWDGAAAHPIPCPTIATPVPPPPGCDAVEGVNHWMAPGNKAHSHHPEGDLVRAVIDSTIRSDAGICDRDHAEDWKRCGEQAHDPDYNKRASAFAWKFSDNVQDRGPNTDEDDKTNEPWENSAQRIILAAPGTCVTVTVCIPEGARTPNGCRITAQGGGCGTRKFRFPEGGDCE